ncbi:MAG: hypothetical protein EHM83_00415 [Burkholderiales bacterium]|nr:MAG: hypothetical protein EHM83_00415 [Burkholderiales bacterium]
MSTVPHAPNTPAFFAAAPAIVVHDALAEFLGAAEGGIVEYRYVDAVRLAGHSCPTVAGAFMMARAALRALYPDPQVLPERGEIRVDCRDARDAGVAGVIASVLGLITGAAGDGGFRGIGGRFVRRDRLFFEQPLDEGEARFTRLDDGRSVEATLRLERVPGDPRMAWAMSRCVGGDAQPEEVALFRELWQDRVRRILVEHAGDPELVTIVPRR